MKFFPKDMTLPLKRFPAAVACSVLIGLLSLVYGRDQLGEVFSFYPAPILPILITLFFASIAVTLFAESNGWAMKKKHSVITIVAALITAIVILNPLGPLFLAVAFGFFLIALSAPYIKGGTNMAYCSFGCQVTSAMVLAYIAGGLLFAGIAILLGSSDYLLGIDWSESFYMNSAIIIGCIFVPYYILSFTAEDFSLEKKGEDQPKPMRFMVGYLVVPMVLAYSVILHLYAMKLVLLWNIPKGELGMLMSAYGVVSIIAYLLSYPLKENGNKAVKIFHRWFFYILTTPTILFIYAMCVRLGDYGVTEKRYVLMAVALWLAGVIIYYFVKRDKMRLQFLSLTLGILCVLAAIGPFSAQNISVFSQERRLTTLLIKNEILVDGTIEKKGNSSEVAFEERKAISSIVEYLVARDETELLKKWLGEDYAVKGDGDAKNKLYFRSSYQVGKKLVEAMGVEYVSRWQQEVNAKHFSYSRPYGNYTNHVSGYDILLNGNISQERKRFFRDGKEEQVYSLLLENNILTISRLVGKSYAIEIDLAAYEPEIKKSDNSKQAFVIEENHQGRSVRLVVTRLSGEKGNNKLVIKNLGFVLSLTN